LPANDHGPTALTRRAAMRAIAAAALGSACTPRHPQLSRPRLRVAARLSGAPGGRELMIRAGKSAPLDREDKLLSAIAAGNLPDRLRKLAPVELPGRLRVWVSADYLSVGSDEDHLRVPLSGSAAQHVAAALGAVLPTPFLVDAIYRAAAIQLDPAPLKLGDDRDWLEELLRHESIIERQLARLASAPGALVAGHKKDVVLSRRLEGRPERLAIYGFHRSADAPIQPVSLAHPVEYTDYSHGVRLIADEAHHRGRAVSLRAMLADPEGARLLSDEGCVDSQPYGAR
jgi:hypothetical protein